MAPSRNVTTSPKRNLIAYILLFFYLLTLYTLVTVFIPDSFLPANIGLIVKLALNIDIFLTIVLGAFIIKRFNKLNFPYIVPFIVIVLCLFLYITDIIVQLAILFIISTIFALSALAFFNYFWRHTNTVEYARFAGFIAFCVLPLFFILGLLPGDSLSNEYFVTFVIALNLMVVLTIFLLRARPQIHRSSDINNKFFEKRVIILYAIPWVLFSLVNATLAKDYPIITNSGFRIFLVGLQAIGANIGAILSGYLADFRGRRMTLALSLALYGTCTVIAGIFSSQWAFSALFFINGLAWGILFVLYFFVIFGDLSNEHNTAKMYAMGLAPYFLSIGIGQIYQPFLPSTANLMLTCLVLFFSIIPIFLAPELSSFGLEQQRKLENYVKRVKKIRKDQG